MDYQQAWAISGAGMDIERLRVDIAARNLAYAHSVLGANGEGYQPLHVIVQASPDALPRASVAASGQAPRQVIDPGHPMADARGIVSYPGVDSSREMMTLMSALRAYEANVVAMNAARTMALKALDIGGAQ